MSDQFSLRRLARRVPFYQQLRRSILLRPRPILVKNRALFEGRSGLEIGGPSHVFSSEDALPVYPLVSRLDNVNYSARTFWSARASDGKYRVGGRELGQELVLDSGELGSLPDESYDFILASHVIEHLANPLKVLRQWRRVLRPGGAAIVIAPNRERTYDRKRPVTTLEHLLEDYERDVGESDTTHQEEVIALHDLSRDGTVRTLEEHVARTRANDSNRIMHHHVFDEKLLAGVLQHAGFQVRQTATVWPHHVVALAVSGNVAVAPRGKHGE